MEKKQYTPAAILKKILKFILFFGVGIFFIYLSIKDLTTEDIQMLKESAAEVKKGSAWIFLAISLVIGAFSHYFRALRSVLLLEPLNYKIRKSMSFFAVMVCYLANLAFPRLGEVLRCTFLQQYEKVPFQKSLGTVVTERAIDLILLLIVVGIAILLNTNILYELKVGDTTLGEGLSQKIVGMLQNFTLYYLLAGLILLIVIIYVTRKKWNKIHFFVKIKHFFIGIWQGLISIKDLKHPILFVIYSLMIWVCYFLGTYFCFFAFDFLSGLGITVVFSCFAFGLIGFVVGPGGLGAYPLIIAGTLVLYGVDYNAGLAAGWVGWGVQTLMVIVFGIISLIAASFMKRTANEVSSND